MDVEKWLTEYADKFPLDSLQRIGVLSAVSAWHQQHAGSEPDLYPEHTKLRAISDQSQACYDFIDWLGSEKGYRLCYVPQRSGTYEPVQHSMRGLLAEFFEIDVDKIETEKRAMIAQLRDDIEDD